MTAHVMAFRPKERVRQDAEPIALLYRTMGTQAAEEVVTRALAELTITVTGLAGHLRGTGIGKGSGMTMNSGAGLGAGTGEGTGTSAGMDTGAGIGTGDLPRQLRRLQRMSEQLGLISLGLVASDARACLDCSDGTGFAAVWARLMRVAELSLTPEPGLLDHSR